MASRDWLEWEHGIAVSLGLARLRADPAHDLVLPDALNAWRLNAVPYLRLMLEEEDPPRVVVTDNLMWPKPEWRPDWHVDWPTLVRLMQDEGYVVERVIAVDVWHRRLFRRTPKWSHAAVAVVTLVLDVVSAFTVPWRRARHTAWRFRAE